MQKVLEFVKETIWNNGCIIWWTAVNIHWYNRNTPDIDTMFLVTNTDLRRIYKTLSEELWNEFVEYNEIEIKES